MTVRKATTDDLDRCYEIAESLPLYFSASGLEILSGDLKHHDVLVAAQGDRIDGFITLDGKSDAVREIGWLAVDPKAQGDGTGSALIEAAEEQSRSDGARAIYVKALA